MTVDVRAAARKEARESHYTWAKVADRYDADLLMTGFEDGAVWVVGCLPTRDEIAEQIATAYDSVYTRRLPINNHDHRAADAVLALIRSKLT